jgi:DNA-binding MarR family transcriptional regulator
MGTHANAPAPRRSAFARHDHETRVVLDNLRLLVRALRVSARGAEKAVGVSGAQLFVLQTLNEAKVASIGELSLLTHTDQSSVSVVVDRLVRRGLVGRAESKADARRAEIRLTPAGRALLRRSPESTQTRLIAGLKALPGGTRRRLGAALGRLAETMGISEAPRMFFEDESPLRKGARKNVRR